MKTSIKYIFIAFLAVTLAACQKIELRKDNKFDKGLLDFMLSIPGQSTEYKARTTGPYNDGDTVYVEVPTTEEEPVDLSQLRASASLQNNAHIQPALTGIMDFTKPLDVTVTDGDGNVKRHVIKAVAVLPRTTFKKLWFNTAEKIGVLRTNISGLAVVKNHILVADFSGGSMAADVGVRVYNADNGSFVKIIAPPTTYCMQVVADDADHFIVNRYNIYSAGLMLYYYEDIDSQPKLILNYTAAAGAPKEIGRKVSVIGNLKEGKAFVYATAPAVDNQIYYWEFENGVAKSTTPTVIRYAGADPWTFATVQRKSLDPNSDHYLTYCNYLGTDPNREKGSRFVQFSPTMDVKTMATSNHYYKIMDFEVFTIDGNKFMAMLTQGYFAWDATHIKVYDITDPNKMALVAESGGYRDFMLFESDAYGGTNYNRYGDLDVRVIGKDITIFATMATDNKTTAGVMAYQMRYNR
ncbi:hypothetical protein E2P86_12330 [Sphingobacterium psychroaquaticum]|uniref:DUF5018 domain-containing protein n=1 Tax=Sphingobacterium psychroaquaticum TaxID=561061 RepID=UPI00106BD805|nr:hypothetical protein [Sphingobacterium psychroaquaticum]QBQ41899.1 hypothetical protein E2P86_12330 [Sphingobacterium psychroaquaticum]